MCIVTEFIAGLLKFEFVFRRHIAGTETEHVCDEYQSTNFLVILHDRSNEEEVVGFNVLAISAEELEVVISAKNVLAENDLRALFSNCGLENLTSLSNEEIQEITVYFAIVTSPSAVLTAGFSIQAFVVIIPMQSGEALSIRIGCLSSCPSGLKTREVSASGLPVILLIRRVTDLVQGHVVGSARFKASIFVTGLAKTFSGSIGSGQRAL